MVGGKSQEERLYSMKTNQKIQEKAVAVCDILDTVYPEAPCSLTYDAPYQLMIAARLSAQCTDARVNIVTKTLFQQYPTLQSFADADLAQLEGKKHQRDV